MTSPFPPPTDNELQEINKLLDWRAGTLLPDGRLLGRLERTPGKRAAPAAIPDARIRLLNQLVPLKRKRVLEVGCFEGIHTAGLVHYCPNVTAVDVRPHNVVKTLARLSWHGKSARVFQADVEKLGPDFPYFDVVFHVGVLYHVKNPVEHIHNLASVCTYVFLDTHVARDETDMKTFKVAGTTYQGAYHGEGGWDDPFSGKHKQSLWLTKKSLIDALASAGFTKVRLLQQRRERNGPRILLLARRFPHRKEAA